MLLPIGSDGGGLLPALALDFLGGTADSRLTVSGGANGTRVDSTGTLVAANAPRFDYNPSTLSALGLLVEEARTNLLLNSLLNGTALSTQSVTVTAQAYTLSFYGTGSVTLSGTSTGTVTGTGAYPARVTSTFTPTAGSLTLTVSGNVQFAQLEAGSFATSFIPTGAAAVTRTADSVSMTGTNFSQWFTSAQGTFVVEADASAGSGTGAKALIEANDGTANNLLRLLARNTGGFGAQAIVSAAVSPDLTPAGTYSANTTFKESFAFAASDFAASANGGAVATSATGSVPAVSQMLLGNSLVSGTAMLNGHVRRLRYFPSRLPNASLQSLTA